MSYMSN